MSKITAFFKKIGSMKYFSFVMGLILLGIPFFIMVYFNQQVYVTRAADEAIYQWGMVWTLCGLEVLAGVLLVCGIGFRRAMQGFSKAMLIAYPALLFFCVEWINRPTLPRMVNFVFRTHYYMSIFIILLIMGLFWVLNSIWRRAWISSALMSAVFMVMGYINLAKMGINGEPFLPSDFAFAENLGDVTGFAKGALPFPKQLLASIILLLMTTLIFFFGREKMPKSPWLRISVGVVCAALVGVSIMLPKVKDKLFMTDTIQMSRQFVQKTVYSNHGFIGGFLINIEGYVAPPEHYSKGFITDTIEKYDTPQNTASFQNPDVIVVLGESFFDLSKLPNVSFTKDPLPNFHRIQKESLSGTMLQASGVGGGTVRSEFEVLTGINLIDMKEGIIPYNTYVPKSKETVYDLPNYFKEFGYSTEAIHTYNKTFYNRDRCYGRMGFDTFLGEQDMEDAVRGDSAKEYIKDNYLIDLMEKEMDKDKDPKFMFLISMENHGSFVEKYKKYDVTATSEKWSAYDTAVANCYVKSASAADEALGKLYDYVMNRERPTVVLFYGDHMPTLGVRHSVLANIGYISTGWSSDWTAQDRYNMYSTPFVIFSNFRQQVEDVGDYSSYMLPSVLLDYIDAPSNGYWNLIKEMREQVRVYNRFLTIDSAGKITEPASLPEKTREIIHQHTLVSYDALSGKRYINSLLLKGAGKK